MRLPHVEELFKLANGLLAIGQMAEDDQPMLVCQGLEKRCRIRCACFHLRQIHDRPIAHREYAGREDKRGAGDIKLLSHMREQFIIILRFSNCDMHQTRCEQPATARARLRSPHIHGKGAQRIIAPEASIF